MSLRSFYRYVEGFNRRKKYDRDIAYQVAALQTAELLNIIGAANSKKGRWKVIQPDKLLRLWTGNEAQDIEERMARLARAEERHKARLSREKAKRSLS